MTGVENPAAIERLAKYAFSPAAKGPGEDVGKHDIRVLACPAARAWLRGPAIGRTAGDG